jgi:hypothetical protein
MSNLGCRRGRRRRGNGNGVDWRQAIREAQIDVEDGWHLSDPTAIREAILAVVVEWKRRAFRLVKATQGFMSSLVYLRLNNHVQFSGPPQKSSRSPPNHLFIDLNHNHCI